MRRSVAFTALLFMAPLAACQAPAPEAGPLSEEDVAAIEASTQVAKLRLVPDWDPVTAVVVGVSQAFGSEAFASASGAGARALLDERLRFYVSIANVSSDVKFIMFVDNPQHATAARSAMRDPDNLSVVARPSWVWMRDFAPLSATLEEGGRALVGYTSYMSEVSQAIADHVALPLVEGAGETAPSIEGGNILVDGQGRCYVSVYSSNGELDTESATEVQDLKNICTDVRTVPEMPYERTGHIDIFARLLDDTTVLVAEYSNEEIYLAAEPVDRRLSCTDQQIRNEAWQECEPIGVVYPDMGRLRRESTGSGQGLPMTVRRSEVISVLRDLYPGEDFEVAVRRYHLGRQEHVGKVAKAFSDYGFRVVRLENPTPYVSMERIGYLDDEGRVVRRIMRVQTIFPTYTNSLMVNGVVYLPQYATASDAQNTQARVPYEKAGFTVVPTDMTQSISFRGATRCLSKEIHGN